MISKLKNWSSKPMSNKLLFIFIAIILVIFNLIFLISQIYDNDMYFLIATGREILKNGIPHTNPWTIDTDQDFISQQWLYTVGIAIADKFSYLGFIVFVSIQLVIMILLLNHFFDLKNIPTKLKFISISIILLLSNNYVFNLRPQLITMILLMIECITLEHYSKNNKWQWLTLLPLTMLLEINLHGSMWAFHFAILLAYMVPTSFIPRIINTSIWKKFKGLFVAIISMIGAMFINPYGLDGITYMFKSFKADTFNYISILEIQAPLVLSFCGFIIMLTVILVILCYKRKILDSVSLNMTLGFTMLLVYMIRNSVFTIFVLAFLVRCLCSSISTISLEIKIKNSSILLFILSIILVLTCMLSIVNNTFIQYNVPKFAYDLKNITDYIDKHDNKNTHIFTGFNAGGYLEYRGYHNIYIDARPELYTDEFTNDKHILADYSKYAISGINADYTNINDKYITQDQIDNWLYLYDFEYIIIDTNSEIYLMSYMTTNNNYELVDLDGTRYILYQKCK